MVAFEFVDNLDATEITGLKHARTLPLATDWAQQLSAASAHHWRAEHTISSTEAHIGPYGIFDGFGVIVRSCAPRRELFNGPLFDLWGSKLAEI
jgi:hypothetical protein